jgi:hypothetical protein
MSLPKTRIAVVLHLGDMLARAFIPGRTYASCSMPMGADQPLERDVPEGLENAVMERLGRQEEPAERTSLRLKIVNAATYVGRMTMAANEAKRHACQGLPNGLVLA